MVKLLHNLVYVQKYLFANNCWRKQSFEKLQDKIAFILNLLSETALRKFCLVLELKNIVSFIKKRFYRKGGC